MRSSSARAAPWRAVHWLRSRQELRELHYWLSLAAYKRSDRSFSNQIYLVYLALFFAAWAFMVLIWLASGAAPALALLNPNNPGLAAAGLAAAALGAWATLAGWQAARRSPVVFSEQDAHLLGQTPASRRWVVLRWLALAWLKSAALPMAFVTVLGFAVAELTLPVGGQTGPVLEYAGYGLRAIAACLPLHLAAFGAVWLLGVLRLQKDLRRPGMPWLVAGLAVGFWACFIAALAGAGPGWEWALRPLLAAYGAGSLAPVLGVGAALAAAALGALAWAAGAFNLSRAAIETQETEKIDTAARYGLAGLAGQLKEQQRLGTGRPPARLQAMPGSAALVWKDRVQRGRARRLAGLAEMFFLFGALFGLALVSDPNARLLALGMGVIQVGQMSVARLRSDLERWPILRQLPFSTKDVLRRDMQLIFWRVVAVSWLALAAAFWLQDAWRLEWLALAPLLAAGAGSAAAFDVLRRARADALLAGGVPQLGAAGVILAAVLVGAPVWLLGRLPGWPGFALALAVGFGLTRLVFEFAVQSYRNIGASS